MMIKIAVVFCAVLATNMVCAKDMDDVEEQALDDLRNLMLSEEVSSPEDNVALQGLVRRTFRRVMRGVRHGLHRGARVSWDLCQTFGYSPEEARAKVLEAYPELKDVVSEEKLRYYCNGENGLHRLRG